MVSHISILITCFNLHPHKIFHLFFGFSLLRFPSRILKLVCLREVSTPLHLWTMLQSPLQRMWDFTIHPLQGPTFSLALVPSPIDVGSHTSILITCFNLHPYKILDSFSWVSLFLHGKVIDNFKVTFSFLLKKKKRDPH